MTPERERPTPDVVPLTSRRVDPPHFAVVPRRAGRDLVLEVSGELDIATGPRLERACAIELMGAGAIDVLVIDFARVSFVDVTGLRAVRRCAELAAGYGTACRVAGYGAQAQRVFTMCSSSDLLETGAQAGPPSWERTRRARAW